MNRKTKDLFEKAVVILIGVIFITGAFLPAVSSKVGPTMPIIDDQPFEKSEDIVIQDIDSESNLNQFGDPAPLDLGDPWWNTEWLYRKEISINHTKVDADLTNFPVLISLAFDADLADGSKCQPDGDDIAFTNVSGNKLNHEIEFFDNNTGELVCWVNVTSLSSSVDTVIYLNYGNSTCDSQENVTGTWDEDYKAVWHLKHTSGDAIDSTANNNDGVEYISPDSNMDAVGVIDGADSFDGSDDYIGINGSLLPTGSQMRTISAWVNTTDTGVNPDGNCIIGYGDQATGQEVLITVENDEIYWRVHGGNRGWSAVDVTNGNWHHLVYVLNGTQTDDMIAYMDGNVLSVATTSLQTLNTASNSNGAIGSRSGSLSWLFNGVIDEVRVSNIARNIGWINTSFINQYNPDTFYSVGSEETSVQGPLVSSPYPADGATGVGLTPVLSIDISDYQGDNMDVYFRTNASTGVWHTIGENLSVGNGTYYCANTSEMNSYNTIYWWCVNVSDAGGNWTNRTYIFTTEIEPGIWWNGDWLYRKQIVIDYTKVTGNSPLVNFPVLVDIIDNDLADDAKCQNNGNDIVFTDRYGNKLSHEIEYFDGSSGNLTVWVNVTSLSDTVNTVLYMYYGNLGCGSQENPVGVWDPSFVMVQHLNETSGLHYDSTTYDNDGSPSVTVQGSAVGKIDGSDEFDGSNDIIDISADSSHDLTDELSISMWIKPDVTYDSSLTTLVVLLNRQAPESDDSYLLAINQDGRLHLGSYGGNIQSTQSSWLADTWYHIVATYRSNLTGELYINGSEEPLSVDNYDLMSSVDRNIEIGGAPGSSYNFFDGVIDEIRLSNITRSAGWYATCYENQHSPGTFYSVGSEETSVEEPLVYSPYPADGATGVGLSPVLSINVSDYQGDNMDVYFRTNASTGMWHTIGENLSVGNGTYYCDNTSEMNSYNSVYWWSVNATDNGSGNWTNATYHFTTIEILSNWGYRELLTINHTKVAGNLTDFPVLVDITHSGLQAQAQADGNDILFTNGSTNWTDPIGGKFSHEIELYNNSTGHLLTWVKLPILSDTVDTVFYMYYGNPNCSSQEDINGVWDSYYKMVQHLNETSGTHYDSTSFGNDGSPSVTLQGSAVGKVDGADGFDGVDDYVRVNDDDSLDIIGDLTVSAWVYPDSFAERNEIICKVVGTFEREFEVRLWRVDVSSAQIRFLDASNDVLSDGTIPVDEWSYIIVIRNSSSSAALFYINGVFDSTKSLSGTVSATDADVCMGTRCPPNEMFHFDGVIDEVRLSDTVRTVDWIQTSYNNQDSPSTFCSFGTPPIVTLVSPGNGTDVLNPVNFTYIPECFSDGGCALAELFFNVTTYSDPVLEWSNPSLTDMDRGLLRDYIVYAFRWTSGPTSIVVFNFTTGVLIEESPQFGDLNPSTAPTLDPTNPDIVYGLSGDGEVVRYNVSSDSLEWETDISQTSSRTLWPCSFPYYDDYLYIAFNNYSLCQVDASNGDVVRWLQLDSGSAEMQIPPRVDEDEGVLYVQDATSMRKLNATDLSEIWNVTIGSDCLLVQTGAYSSRFIPMLVNDSFTGDEPWIITQCGSEQKIFAINASGYEVWNQSLESRIRSMPNYHPDRGWIYLNKFTFTDGKVYVLNITDGSFLFNFTYPNDYPSNRELMLTKNYVISKTDRGSGVTDYLYVFDNRNGSLVGGVDIGTPRFHCDPLITSAGITMILHSPSNGGNAWRLGSGEYYDYYPFTGANGYQYLENALTSYGIANETWESQKMNETTVVNNSLNGIVFDFSGFSLPEVFRWNIRVTDSNGYSSFADEDRISTVHQSLVQDPSPADGTTNVSLSPTLSVYVTDLQGDNLDVWFRTNASTGVWHIIGENLSVGSGRVYCDNTSEINNYNTMYWWSVNVSDGSGNWTNETYWFITLPNNPPIFSNEIPSNGSVSVSLSPVLSINVSDYNEDSMDVYFRTNASTGVWHTIGENLSVGNGTYYCDNTSEMNSYNSVYWWSVNATDSGSGNWTNATYHFTTIDILSNWGYRELLTINHTKVAGNLTDFPVLVDITHSGLQAQAQADGNDILFTNGSTNWTDPISGKFSHEIELYNNSTGHLLAWVKLPILSDTVDTVFYMYYGNPNCSSQEDINGVWDSYYKMVQHLNETSGMHVDSTGFGNTGTPSVTVQGSADGKIDGADEFDGTDDYIQVSDNDSLDITGDLTISGWVYPDFYADRNEIICKIIDDVNREYEIRLWRVDASSAQIRFIDASNNVLSDGTVPVDTWSYLTVVRNSSSSTALFYIDGVLDSTKALSGSVSSTAADVWIARRSNGIFPFDGLLDEIRVSDTVRTADWIQTSYNNQDSPSTFYGIVTPTPNVTLVSPVNGSTVVNPVNFTYIPECFTDGGCAQAELFFNSTIYSEGGTNEWSNPNLVDMDRAVLRDHMAFGIHWTSGPCYIMVFNFTTGEVIHQSPVFGDRNPSTAPTLDPNNPDIVYGFSGDGEVVRYNMSSDSFEWETDISNTSSLVFWANFVPIYDGYLYLSYINCSLCQVDASNGDVLRWLQLDSGIAEMQFPPRVDEDEGVLYVQDATSLRKLNATDLSEIWNVTIGSNCLYVESGAYSSRFTPLLVNDSYTGNEPWIITECANDRKIFAINASGFEMWNQTLDSKIRAMPCYHPDRGWIYLNNFTFTDGKVYVVNITDGSFVFNFTYPNDYPSNRPMMLTGEYLISKTDRGSGVTDYLYVFDNRNGTLVGSVNIGTQRFHCDPLITSAGYTLITHSYHDSVDLWKLGEGEYYDYNPYTGANGYQYLENALTRFGFVTEVWESRKINETPVVNNTINSIMFDFSDYSLPGTFRWNINVTDTNGYSSFAAEDRIVVVRLPPIHNPIPADGATGVNLNPVLSIDVTDYQGEALDVLFRTNASTGVWHTIGENLSVINRRVYCSNTSEMNNLNTTYWWSVNASDAGGNWTNSSYSFSTLILLSNWQYRKEITINHTEVVANLTNFPMLIQITNDSDLASHAQSDFDDILFTNSSVNWLTGSPNDRLNHEIEMYDNSSGNLTVWVNITDLSSSTDTILHMYYGNLDCENQENAAGTWNDDYAFVLHLNETSGTHYDSTANNNDGTPLYGTVQDVVGKIDGADSFDGVDDLIDISADDSHDLYDELTITMWIKPDVTYDSSLSNHLVLLNRQQPEGDDSYILLINQDGRLHLGSYGGNIQSTQESWQADTWYHVVATYRSNLTGELYINGSDELLSVDNYDSMSSVNRNVEIGDAPGDTYIGFDGIIDEVRVLNTAVKGDWVATEYSNQQNPAAFYFVGAEENVSVGDMVPPEITNVNAQPDPQYVGGYVNITCDVIDDVGIYTVKVNISGPDGFTPINTTMSEGSYYYNTSYSIGGTYTYFIWANDTSDNANTSSNYHFEVKRLYNISVNTDWNLISLPFNESIDKTNIIVRNNSIDYNWTNAVSEGIILDYLYNWTGTSYDYVNILEPGYGYWSWAFYDCQLLFSSSAEDVENITSLLPGWSIVGLPYNQSLAKEDLIIHYNVTDYSWENATGTNNEEGEPLILGFIYGWNRTNQFYMLYDIFDPGYGYWMYAYYDCILKREAS